TFMGPVESEASIVYLRPETAQGIYVNFLNVASSSRQKVPFGIAQIGKAFRNEITPGNFIFRTREFEQMEMQFFVKPGEDEKWFEYWKEQRIQWHLDNGIRKNKLRFHAHGPGELAHYAKAAFDIEYEFPFGWQELEGIHNRSNFDLGRHQEFSGKKLEYFDEQAKERYLPFIVETSAGCDRTLLVALVDAFRQEEDRVFLALHPKLSAYKVAIFPLMKKEPLMEAAEKIHADVKKRWRTTFDESGSIGKRYYRQDEIGTPFCVTIDFDTVEKGTITIRHRDTKQQDKIETSRLIEYLDREITGWTLKV
ncbi:MAG: glycine--tRNA ligase, partial [Deltaproteobacteria bacterium]|nr:glycine--tRNA ligase [Deltaproteobacteria bacterium]